MVMLLARVIQFLLWSQDIKSLPVLDHWVALIIILLLQVFDFFFVTVVNWLLMDVLPLLNPVYASVSRATWTATMLLIFPASIEININLLLLSD